MRKGRCERRNRHILRRVSFRKESEWEAEDPGMPPTLCAYPFPAPAPRGRSQSVTKLSTVSPGEREKRSLLEQVIHIYMVLLC